ncbi:hypothetical protein [uncultured Anaerococcus sp.]|uniref:hypothetical protein n=1 Tax=uncultured Anaerococcus sp. TaxID=293428 RepID=UPI0026282E05|nr:hypothetical protein [uncultured Anaerococcus sp.]
MKKPIDRFEDKSEDEIYQKERLLDEDNLEDNDRLAMFLAALRVFLPGLLIVIAPLILLAIFI